MKKRISTKLQNDNNILKMVGGLQGIKFKKNGQNQNDHGIINPKNFEFEKK